MEAPGRDRQQRDVYISDHQHLVPAADPHQHDRPSQYGSVDPAAIAGPALLATIASTAAGVVFCKVMDRKNIDF